MTTKNTQRGFTIIELTAALLGIVCVIGWVWNIIKIIGLMGGDITTEIVVRCIGVFVAPLGAILGYF